MASAVPVGPLGRAVERRRHAEAADEADGIEERPEEHQVAGDSVDEERDALQHGLSWAAAQSALRDSWKMRLAGSRAPWERCPDRLECPEDPPGQMSRQRIRYLRTSDGMQLAWAEAGAGPPLVKAANWLTHLEYDWDSPVWRHWIRFLSGHFRFLRYDERGCGMTDWKTGDLSFERWVEDLEGVVDAAAPREPFALLGISQGAAVCVAYAVRHPERVSRLVLYGGYARGWTQRPSAPGRTRVRGHHRADAHGLGQGQSRVPPGLHVALHPGRQRTSRSSGSTTCAARPRRPRSRPSCSRPAPTST